MFENFDIKNYIIGFLVVTIMLMFVCIYSIKAKYKDFAPYVEVGARSVVTIPPGGRDIKILGPNKFPLLISIENGLGINWQS